MKEICVLDLETTSLDPRDGMIVEIGIVSLDLDTGKKKVVYDEITREGDDIPLNAWVFDNTSLTREMVKNGLDNDVWMPQVQAILDKFPVVAWNTQFDFSFLDDRLIDYDPLPCPMKTVTEIVGLNGTHGGGYKWPKFQEAWDYYQPDGLRGKYYKETHRALDDAWHEAVLINHLYKVGHWNPEEWVY
jgi:DNA polymerase III alpha subunit (gram-positive type)